MTWLTVLADLWAGLRERDTLAHREHLLRCAEDPLTSLRGHRAFALIVFAFGLVIGLGIGVGVVL